MNFATERGGAIYLKGASTNNIGNAHISSNKAKYGAGLCSQDNSKNEIGSATFESNEAKINGGAIYMEHGGLLNINTGASFTNNQAISDGGGAICIKSNYTKYMDVILTGVSDDGAQVEKLVALSVGYWQVSETDWSFTYKNADPVDFELSKLDAQKGVIKELEYVNTKQTTPPIYSDEELKVNELSF